MTDVTISDSDLARLKGKVVVITGGSTGIGLAAAQILCSLGAYVVCGNRHPPKDFKHPNFQFFSTDVSQWADLLNLFKQTKTLHGRIDHVFANAGVPMQADYLATDLDDNGDLKEPTFRCHEINYRGCLNTVTLAIYYMRAEKQEGGGSIVVSGSMASIQRFRAADYASAKHGVLGFTRAIYQNIIISELPIRINMIAPSWTESAITPTELVRQFGIVVQKAEVAARSALILMADEKRNGQLIHSAEGICREVEESILLPASVEVIGKGKPTEDETVGRLVALIQEQAGTGSPA